MKTYDEYVNGWYGGRAWRVDSERSVWQCWWGDEYSWKAVMDDFGDLTAIGPKTNHRWY